MEGITTTGMSRAEDGTVPTASQMVQFEQEARESEREKHRAPADDKTANGASKGSDKIAVGFRSSCD